jgi:hypothetical protein
MMGKILMGTYKILMGTYKFMMGTYKFMMGTYKFMMGTYKFMMGTYKFMMGTYKMQVMHKFVLVSVKLSKSASWFPFSYRSISLVAVIKRDKCPANSFAFSFSLEEGSQILFITPRLNICVAPSDDFSFCLFHVAVKPGHKRLFLID